MNRRTPRPRATVIRSLALLVSAGLSLALLTTPAEAKPTARAAAAVGTYVAVGDSFAAGEGLSPYVSGTATASNTCDRSVSNSYPVLLEKRSITRFDKLTSVACSGAITPGLLFELPDNSDEKAQLKVLSSKTKTVTLTIGGNDVGFSTVLADCTYTTIDIFDLQSLIPGRPGCEQRQAAGVQRAITRLGGADVPGLTKPTVPMVTILGVIHKLAPNAKIYVTGYPDLFGTTFTDGYGCQVAKVGFIPFYITGSDARWVSRTVRQLNSTIQAATAQARTIGVPATYVDVAGEYAKHGLCDSGTAWINPLVVTTEPSLALNPGSFHPTARGQRATADAVADAAAAKS